MVWIYPLLFYTFLAVVLLYGFWRDYHVKKYWVRTQGTIQKRFPALGCSEVIEYTHTFHKKDYNGTRKVPALSLLDLRKGSSRIDILVDPKSPNKSHIPINRPMLFGAVLVFITYPLFLYALLRLILA